MNISMWSLRNKCFDDLELLASKLSWILIFTRKHLFAGASYVEKQIRRAADAVRSIKEEKRKRGGNVATRPNIGSDHIILPPNCSFKTEKTGFLKNLLL